MAGIVVTKLEWDALLQEDYLMQGVVEAVNKATPFKSKLRRKSANAAGRRRIYPVQVGMSQGNGARAEGENTPDYGAEAFQDAIVQAKYNYATFKVTGPAQEFSNRRAWVDFVDQVMQGTKEGLTQDIARQCWGDGSGKLALVNNGAGYAAAATTIVVDSAFGIAWGSLAAKTTALLKKDMLIQFGLEDNNGLGYKIASVTATGIVLSTGLVNAIVDNVAIYKFKAKDKEITGFLKFVATSAFQTGVLGLGDGIYNGIDRATYDAWEGNVVNGGGAALSLTLIRSLKDVVFSRTDEESANLCIVSPYIAAAYEALLVPNQRYVPAVKLEGGHTALEHDGLRFTRDSKAPVKSVNLLDTDKVAWMETRAPHWFNDGSGPMRAVPGQDASDALLRWYAELDCPEPRRQGILYDVI